ncbi:MAG: Glycine cleavage system H protein [Candidatus Lokiarchaeum sp. GC14_75]|nr:MAG: Glycine cleavage system H protein [Candidatus Lokiarchaeum sp. GC14_75]
MTKWFTKTHQWFDDGTKEVGITPYAADQLGEISFVDVEGLEGAELEQVTMDGDEPTSDPIDCTVESSKAVGDIYSPVSGSVTEINTKLMDEPEKINEDAFTAWLFKIEPSNWDADKGNLIDESAYNAFIG